MAALENVQEDYHDQMGRAHVRAEGRTRFKELCSLSKVRGDKRISQDTYVSAKEDLISLWRAQSSTPQAVTSPRLAALTNDDENARSSPMGDFAGWRSNAGISETFTPRPLPKDGKGGVDFNDTQSTRMPTPGSTPRPEVGATPWSELMDLGLAGEQS